MANVFNKLTGEYLRSVNTPDYTSSEWAINPRLDGVDGIDERYWKWDSINQAVVEMTTDEKSKKDLVSSIIPRPMLTTWENGVDITGHETVVYQHVPENGVSYISDFRFTVDSSCVRLRVYVDFKEVINVHLEDDDYGQDAQDLWDSVVQRRNNQFLVKPPARFRTTAALRVTLQAEPEGTVHLLTGTTVGETGFLE